MSLTFRQLAGDEKGDIGLDLAKFYKQLTGMSETDISGTSTEISEKSSPNITKTSTPVAMETSDRYIFNGHCVGILMFMNLVPFF